MSELAPVYILPTHLPTDDLHEAEDALYHAGGRLSYRAPEARIFLGKVLHKKRAAFDLRARGVWTTEAPLPSVKQTSKRRKLDLKRNDRAGSDTETASEGDKSRVGLKRKHSPGQRSRGFPDLSNHVVVLKLEWLDACTKSDMILAIDPYVVYCGKIIEKPAKDETPAPVGDGITYIKAVPEAHVEDINSGRVHDLKSEGGSILERAKADATTSPSQNKAYQSHRRKFGQQSASPALSHSSPPAKLYRATTSELEISDSSKLPPLPPWVTEPHPRPMYSCLRSTPPLEESPNRHFINQLTKIKEGRLLTLDEIGVRAYSTSIASLAAYPHRITSPTEILRLPGCNDKIASLWIEWHESITLSDRASPSTEVDTDPNTNSADADTALDPVRTISAVTDLATDKSLQHIGHFHQIWGVGPDTARKFYLNHGWTDLDDIVEFGWTTLSRVQQIGVKFFDEFQHTIPRPEVEDIARTVLHHARLVRDIDPKHWTNDVVDDNDSQKPDDNNDTKPSPLKPTINGADKPRQGSPLDFIAVPVGGYRRGKLASGDVDVIISHRDERMTQDLVVDLVASLEAAGYVTHTLTLHTTTSDRGQQTLPFHGGGGGHGFDSLDKALVVWQDPNVSDGRGQHGSHVGGGGGDAAQKEKKNPNVHRRVDIIVTPWRTVGCAVLGWSGGTTFQRDIRRWVKRERGWKFDSSGVRDRGNGSVLDLEGPDDDDDGDGYGDGWEDRERRLMVNLGIGWRPARERCTG